MVFGCDSHCFSWTEPGTFDPGNEGFTRLCVGPCWAELLSLPALLRASGDGQVVLTMSVAWLGGPCCEHILAGFFLSTLWGAAEHSGGSTWLSSLASSVCRCAGRVHGSSAGFLLPMNKKRASPGP